jgi:hypothetical protein
MTASTTRSAANRSGRRAPVSAAGPDPRDRTRPPRRRPRPASRSAPPLASPDGGRLPPSARARSHLHGSAPRRTRQRPGSRGREASSTTQTRGSWSCWRVPPLRHSRRPTPICRPTSTWTSRSAPSVTPSPSSTVPAGKQISRVEEAGSDAAMMIDVEANQVELLVDAPPAAEAAASRRGRRGQRGAGSEIRPRRGIRAPGARGDLLPRVVHPLRPTPVRWRRHEDGPHLCTAGLNVYSLETRSPGQWP